MGNFFFFNAAAIVGDCKLDLIFDSLDRDSDLRDRNFTVFNAGLDGIVQNVYQGGP